LQVFELGTLNLKLGTLSTFQNLEPGTLNFEHFPLKIFQSFSTPVDIFKIGQGAIVFVLNILKHFESFVKRFEIFCRTTPSSKFPSV